MPHCSKTNAAICGSCFALLLLLLAVLSLLSTWPKETEDAKMPLALLLSLFFSELCLALLVRLRLRRSERSCASQTLYLYLCIFVYLLPCRVCVCARDPHLTLNLYRFTFVFFLPFGRSFGFWLLPLSALQLFSEVLFAFLSSPLVLSLLNALSHFDQFFCCCFFLSFDHFFLLMHANLIRLNAVASPPSRSKERERHFQESFYIPQLMKKRNLNALRT